MGSVCFCTMASFTNRVFFIFFSLKELNINETCEKLHLAAKVKERRLMYFFVCINLVIHFQVRHY